MSINVTVRGNPISIKRGRMVTHDVESEFERRRRIRLQQVRQQSKEIAANIRNRVRREKENQLSKVEQRTEDELKRWKARKLAKLQKQLQESDRLRGDAQERAKQEPDCESVLRQINEKNHLEAIERGKIAVEEKVRLQKEALQEAQRRIELKKKIRQVEDARSALVSKIRQEQESSNKKKSKQKQNNKRESKKSSTRSGHDKESQTKNGKKDKKIQKLDIDISSPDQQSPSTSRSLSGMSSPSSPPSPKKIHKSKMILKSPAAVQKPTKKQKKAPKPASPTVIKSPTSFSSLSDDDGLSYCYRPSSSASNTSSDNLEYRTKPVKTGKKKDSYLNYDSPKVCKAPCAEIATQTVRTASLQKKVKPKEKTSKKEKKDSKFEIKSHDVVEIPAELPYVPTTCIEQTTQVELCPAQAKRVSCVDLDNKFVSTYETEPLVEKISKLNLIRDEEDTEEKLIKNLQKQMTARDNKAQQRGVKAFHKHKVQKDYEKLLEELPVLQRQERLAQMKTHDPTLHMSENRIKQLEKRRQHKIENIFEKYYNRAKILETPTITIRPVQKPAPTDEMKLPFRALDVTESPVELNVGCWERPCFEPISSPYKTTIKTNALHTFQPQTQQVYCNEVKCQQQQDVLMDLLARVNRQRELLMQEVASLPTGKTKTLVSEGTGPSPPTTKSPKKSRRSTKTVATSPLKPMESSSSKTKLSVTSNTSLEIKPKKHRKKKRKEEETQTSPSIKKLDVNMMFVTDSSDKEKDAPPNKCQHCPPLLICSCPPQSRSGKKEDCICSKEEEQGDANKKSKDKKTDTSNRVCEIVIKTKENAHVKVSKHGDSPKVVLNVTKKDTKSSTTKSHPSTRSSLSTAFQSLPKHSDKTNSDQTHSDNTDPTTYKHLLYDKPQQTNVDKETKSLPEEKKICPNLLKYIKKLLSMSRKSIDELTVSTISDVSTPGNSVINGSPNVTPLMQLQSIMQKYNLSITDIQKQLTPSSSEISIKQKPPVVPEFSTTTSTESDKILKPVRLKSPVKRKSSPKKDAVTQKGSSQKSTKSSKSWSPSTHEEVSQILEEQYGIRHGDMQEIPNILSRYKDLTQTCCERICKLTKLIDNVRLEKERILSPASDKYETSATSYFELPQLSDSTRSGGNKNESETSSMSQGEVDRYLLAVDKSASPRPKSPKPKSTSPQRRATSSPTKSTSPQRRTTPSPPRRTTPSPTKSTSPKISPRRFSSDVQQSTVPDSSVIKITAPPPSFTTICVPDNEINPPSIEDEVPLMGVPQNSKIQPFIPMLQGIPKFHETEQDQSILNKSPTKYVVCPKSRPPPSLRNNRFELDVTPHELSTINELDTMLSKSISDIIVKTPKTDRQHHRSSSSDEPHMHKQEESSKSPSPTGKKSSKAGSPTKGKTSPDKVRLSKSDSKPAASSARPATAKTKPRSPQRNRPSTPSPKRSSKQETQKNILVKSSSSSPESSPVISGVVPLSDKSTSSSADDMAAILQKMGMGWAVATLKKTQEQYVLSSSSSSSATSFKRLSKDSSSPTDVSYKNILSIGIERKVASFIYSESPEFELQARPDMEICGCDYTMLGGKDASTQRTSTPVHHSKSTDSKKDLFTGDSDLSSVRMNSDEFLFLSIPNVSLDTNKTLNRSND